MALVSKLASNTHNVWQQIAPLKYLQENQGVKICLLLLNRPLEKCQTYLKRLWNSAVIRVCADGALDRLNKTVGADKDKFIPDLICGDFDSVPAHLLDYHKKMGAVVVPTPDQDATDFTKSIQQMLKKLTEQDQLHEYDAIVCLGAFGGRFDHVMANLNTLYTASELQQKPCYLLSSTNLACLLQPGSYILDVGTGFEGDWCGLIPLGSPIKSVYTTGLKWNLDGETLSFGSLVSTSNTFEGKHVTIETTEPLLWTMGVTTA